MSKKFPNLFIIGAMKAGTSSLHEYLHQHPQIFMSRFKEPQYFAPRQLPDGSRWDEGIPDPEGSKEWYAGLFADVGDAQYAGESSTSYTKLPWSIGSANRIHRHNPESRLIYLMREPIERSISHYWQNVRSGVECRPIVTALRRDQRYTAYSRYSHQLEPYLNLFSEERIFLMTLEELTKSPQSTFQRLFRWLDVDWTFNPSIDEKFNVAPEECRMLRRPFGWSVRLTQHWRFRRFCEGTPRAIVNITKGICFRKIIRSEANTKKAIEYLRPLQEEQISNVGLLMRRPMEEWQ